LLRLIGYFCLQFGTTTTTTNYPKSYTSSHHTSSRRWRSFLYWSIWCYNSPNLSSQ